MIKSDPVGESAASETQKRFSKVRKITVLSVCPIKMNTIDCFGWAEFGSRFKKRNNLTFLIPYNEKKKRKETMREITKKLIFYYKFWTKVVCSGLSAVQSIKN